MIIIAGSSHKTLALEISKFLGVEYLEANSNIFADHEWRIQINRNLYNKNVFIVQSTSKPANDSLMELLLIADTAKRAGAKKITAIIPYFGYARQDRPSYRYGPISAKLVADLIETSGINRVITIDLHSKQSEGFFNIPIQNIDPLPSFAERFKNLSNVVVVSPDIGGINRASNLANLLNCNFAIINKTRQADGSCHMQKLIGHIKDKHCILVDDIVDTANTICQAATTLKNEGCSQVDCVVTHAVFSSDSLEKIMNSNINNFYISDSIETNLQSDKIKKISILPLFDFLKNQ
jgi:ribose-phosphate pyrophosphokinase